MFHTILFDLDGTLTDSREGITKCVQYALAAYGIDEPDLTRLEAFIGPPLDESFMHFYGVSAETAAAMIEKFRERFSPIGIFENALYPGIAPLLARLKAAGRVLAVASSKPTPYVAQILEHFSIAQYFDLILGSEFDGRRPAKEDVVQDVLAALGHADVCAANPDPQIAMVGDRKFDVQGARAFGLCSVAVGYGFAQPGELDAAGPDRFADTVEELGRVLLEP